MLADGLKLSALRCIHSPAGPGPQGRDLEVEAGALVLGETPRGKYRCDMSLEGRLVFGEAGVSIDAIQRHPWAGDQARREGLEVDGELLDDVDHRRSHQRFVLILAGLEPLAVVVALQGAQKGERLRAESGRDSVVRHEFDIPV